VDGKKEETKDVHEYHVGYSHGYRDAVETLTGNRTSRSYDGISIILSVIIFYSIFRLISLSVKE
jgi:hypothetical protein